MAWIDRLSMRWLVVGAVVLGLAPFYPRPHLVEKLGMLAQGTLRAPVDIFDLALHGALPVLLLIRLLRQRRASGG